VRGGKPDCASEYDDACIYGRIGKGGGRHGETLLRLSVGIEDPEDLMVDLTDALARAERTLTTAEVGT
jgi:hypothetical protein